MGVPLQNRLRIRHDHRISVFSLVTSLALGTLVAFALRSRVLFFSYLRARLC
jgi:hypothetical protein